MSGSLKKHCTVCAKEYYVTPSRSSNTKYCSRMCDVSSRLKKSNRLSPKYVSLRLCSLRPAKECGHLTKRGRKLCPYCRKSAKKWLTVVCAACAGVFKCNLWDVSRKKTCSEACHRKWVSNRQKGNKTHLWKGGITTENKLLRNSMLTDEWRRQVFKRDSFTCQNCGQYAGKLCADHIKPWCRFPDLRFDISNGRTLCWPCHRKTPTFGSLAITAKC